METQKEYDRITALFKGCDEKQLALIDGAIWEAARLRSQLNDLNRIAAESGLIKLHPNNPGIQKELPVSRLIVKVRANYLNYIAKLSGVLGKNVNEEDDPLSEYE